MSGWTLALLSEYSDICSLEYLVGIGDSSGLFASWCNIVAFSQKVLFATIVFTLHLVFSKTSGKFWAAKENISKQQMKKADKSQ